MKHLALFAVLILLGGALFANQVPMQALVLDNGSIEQSASSTPGIASQVASWSWDSNAATMENVVHGARASMIVVDTTAAFTIKKTADGYVLDFLTPAAMFSHVLANGTETSMANQATTMDVNEAKTAESTSSSNSLNVTFDRVSTVNNTAPITAIMETKAVVGDNSCPNRLPVEQAHEVAMMDAGNVALIVTNRIIQRLE